MNNYKETLVTTLTILMLTAMIIPAVLASSVDESIVDATAPTGSVALGPGASSSITINMAVTGKQDGTATFDVYTTWTLSGGIFTGSNPQTFTVPPRPVANDPATTFTTSGTITVASGQAAGTFNLAVGAIYITNSNPTGAKLGAGSSSNYQVTVTVPSDTTPPVSTIDIQGTSGVGGWYVKSPVTVTLSATDNGGSGVSHIYYALNGGATQIYTAPIIISAEGSTTISYWAVDKATNTETARETTVKIDTVAPITGQPTFTGTKGNSDWYKSDVSVEFAAPPSDPTPGSGLKATYYDIGSGTQTYTAPFTLTDGITTITYSSEDNAGNTETSQSATVKIDTIAPVITLNANREPNPSGWYNSAVGFTVSASDSGGSGIVDPTLNGKVVTYSGPDSATASISVSATDEAGNTATATATLKYDATAPTLHFTPDRLSDQNDWYNHAVTWTITGDDSVSGIASTDDPITYTAPDSSTASVTGHVTDVAGNVGTDTIIFKYDATAPVVTATPSRTAPDHNGWYNHAINFAVAATDDISGIASKDNDFTYSTPDSATASVSASATDNAGNIGSATFNFKYDGTAPTIACNEVTSGQIFGLNQPVTATWTVNDGCSGIDGACPAVQTVDTSTVGTHSLNVPCVYDCAGNPSVTSAISYSVIYSTTNGHKILQPLEQVSDPSGLTKGYKVGSTLPVKFQLCDYYGNSIGPINPMPTIAIAKASSLTDPADSTVVLDSGLSNDGGNTFRYESFAKQYIFNLSTKNLAIGTYRITVSLNDGSNIVTFFELKK